MEPYQDRMIAERNELKTRLDRLYRFQATPEYLQLEPEDRDLLVNQSVAMNHYLIILDKRIARFLVEAAPE